MCRGILVADELVRAGDAWIAGFLAGIVGGWDLDIKARGLKAP
jgi:fructose-1-phosphate kinase PfkB-like protein